MEATAVLKLTILFNHPEDEDAFETHLAERHLPLYQPVAEYCTRVELTRCAPSPHGEPAPYYRLLDVWFAGPAELNGFLHHGQPVVADLQTFASGGFQVLLGEVEEVSLDITSST
jgi:uncharacterized protein (TIGR02118 family)